MFSSFVSALWNALGFVQDEQNNNNIQKVMKHTYTNRLVEQLNKDIGTDNSTKLIELIKKHDNAVITGSYLLQVLTGKFYNDENSDIDIFIGYHDKNQISKCTINNLFENNPNNFVHNYTLKQIITTIKYKYNNKYINLVYIDLNEDNFKSITDYIHKRFDMSATMSSFDGHQITCMYPELTLYNKMIIINGYESENHLNGTDRYCLSKRLIKYVNRGATLLAYKDKPILTGVKYEDRDKMDTFTSENFKFTIDELLGQLP